MYELCSLSAVGCRLSARKFAKRQAFTLVEMLVAMAITLVMMAAVVTLFANVTSSVSRRRATTEMSNQLRQLRNTLQQDLQGATCPGVTWQRPESNHGYIEVIEGVWTDQNPSGLVFIGDTNGDGQPDLDPTQSTIPRNNVGLDGADGTVPNGEITTREIEAHYRNQNTNSFVPGGLGDHDDILMLTTRNEHEPFVGRMPTNVRSGNTANAFDVNDNTPAWGSTTIASPLAEVVWFCVENPATAAGEDTERFFGEPGIRTVYRRTFLIAPWLNPYSLTNNNGQEIPFTHTGRSIKAEPGLVRVLPNSVGLANVAEAIAAIIAFQDRYDLSVRLEWDQNIQRWKIMANTLGDLTKRENRFGHFGFNPATGTRSFPFVFVTNGQGYSGTDAGVRFVTDPELNDSANAAWRALIGTIANFNASMVSGFKPTVPADVYMTGQFLARPFAYVSDAPSPGGIPATANATLNERGQVVRLSVGPAPLWGSRRGQDVMMTEVLGFDLRVYDPGAPLYGRRDIPGNTSTALTVLQPTDPGWKNAYNRQVGQPGNGFEFVGQGAYVDMGYVYPYTAATMPIVAPTTSWVVPWFAEPRGVSNVLGAGLSPGYSVYDTWSFHYENNGINEDGDTEIDEGTNGLDDIGVYRDPATLAYVPDRRLGPDDPGERETTPPYDRPLRGVQVLVRSYEPDSRAIRQVRVNQHFLQE